MKKSEHQHFVPRVYLRNFSHKGTNRQRHPDMISRKDKTTGIIKEISIRDANVKRNIYTDDYLRDPYQWEKQFGAKEKELKNVFINIINLSRLVFTKSGDNILNYSVKKDLANAIVIQMLRTPNTLEYMRQTCYKDFPYIMAYLKKCLVPKLPDDKKEKVLNYQINEPLIKNVNLQVVFDLIEDGRYSDLLLKKTWIIYRLINCSEDFCFYTSDNPVITCDIKGELCNIFESGISNPFTMVLYPLSKDIMISIYGGTSERLSTDGKILFLNKEQNMQFVDKINYVQTCQCSQYVFF